MFTSYFRNAEYVLTRVFSIFTLIFFEGLLFLHRSLKVGISESTKLTRDGLVEIRYAGREHCIKIDDVKNQEKTSM